MTPALLELDLGTARRVAVMAQLLLSPKPRSIDEVVRGLGEVQMDPTRAVARTEHLVLWSRLGQRFRVVDLEHMLWDDRSLFEYRAHIVHVDDYAIHRESMRRFAGGLPERPQGARGSRRRGLADRRMERRREEHRDDARDPVGSGRGDDRPP